MHSIEGSCVDGANHTWVLVLAGGEGSRLRSLTTSGNGVTVPKQFCSIRGGASLLQETLERAESIVPRHRIRVILAEHQRQWWKSHLRLMSASTPFVQPQNRGTGIAILLPLLQILYRDPKARIVVLPCDHFVQDEETLSMSIHQGLARLQSRSVDVLMLGIEPEMPDPELGYIVPARGVDDDLTGVSQFVEKPSVLYAQELIAQGGLWNAFIVVAKAQGLLRLFENRHPRAIKVLRRFVELELRGLLEQPFADAVFERLPHVDFSLDVVTGQEPHLNVQRVPRCGWSDLGTPRTVSETLRKLGRADRRISVPDGVAG